jgi:hypothetical protein
MSCADKIKDKSGVTGGDANREQNRLEMEACVAKCGDEMLKTLPSFSKRIKEWFQKGMYKQ